MATDKVAEVLRMRPGGRSSYIGVAVFIELMALVIVALAAYRWGSMDGSSILLLLLILLFLWRIVRAGVELTEAAVNVRWLIGVRRIPWSDIADIRTGGNAGGRQASLLLRDGRAVKLPAPAEWWPAKDHEFEAKMALLRDWWAKHRG
jgi:hypothetical protein